MNKSVAGVLLTCAFVANACAMNTNEPTSEPASEVATNTAEQALSTASGPRGGTVKDAPINAAAALAPRATVPPGTALIGSSQKSSGPAALSAGAGAATGGAGACAYNVTNHGGPIISTPRVSRVFWGTWNATTANSYDNTWSTMANTPSFYLRVKEYGIGIGAAGTRTNYTAGATGSVSEASITAGLTSALTSAGITPTAQEVFVIFLPSGTTSAQDIANSWAGHHNHYTATINSHSYNVRYAVIEYSSNADYTNPVVSHELMEAFSDPDLNAYYDGNNEIGDICRFAALPGGYGKIAGTQIETVWTQKGCRCVVERDLNGIDRNLTGNPMPTVFRPSDTTWYGYGASPWWIFGASTDVPYGGDYDGDGRTEFSLFRDAASANVFLLNTATGIYSTYNWGTTGDKPVLGDFDGDGRTDIAVWRPSNGTWYVRQSSTGTLLSQQWGLNGDIPTPGDYDGDHKTDFAVFRPSDGNWYVIPSATPSGAYWAHWGATYGDIMTPGDYDSDGFTDLAFWHPANGTFYIWELHAGVSFGYQWGQSGDIPVPQDYDGDYHTDISVWRPGNGTWYFVNSGGGGTSSLQWGQSGDIPIERSVLR